jgi:hypothetical protein
MPETLFPPAIKSGIPSADGSGKGSVVLAQSATLTQNSTTAVSATFKVPFGYPNTRVKIIDIIVDVEVVFNSASSATLTVGTAAAGTQYASGVDVKAAAARLRPTFTAAQLTAMKSLTSENVVATITPSGATSTGTVTVTVLYEVG